MEKARPDRRAWLSDCKRQSKTICSTIAVAELGRRLGVEAKEAFCPSIPFVATVAAALVMAEALRALAFPRMGSPGTGTALQFTSPENYRGSSQVVSHHERVMRASQEQQVFSLSRTSGSPARWGRPFTESKTTPSQPRLRRIQSDNPSPRSSSTPGGQLPFEANATIKHTWQRSSGPGRGRSGRPYVRGSRGSQVIASAPARPRRPLPPDRARVVTKFGGRKGSTKPSLRRSNALPARDPAEEDSCTNLTSPVTILRKGVSL